MKLQRESIAPGARVEIRDAEWIIRTVQQTSTGGYALHCVGVSEIVNGKESIFLSDIEKQINVLDPENTKLVVDDSRYFRDTKLYIESLMRNTPPGDEKIHIAHKAAIDVVPYQFDPAQMALEQPRQRILMADTTGLGKTIEVGILLSELIKRGKAKRVLVLAVKSMLTQFQKELWSRFNIPLVRLDSKGIQKIRSDIPSNSNPFFYYDKSIIPIDTLKRDREYRTYLEQCYWDVIVIDEAQHVATRKKKSDRAKLAELLATRSDTLILASATPHDGSAESFASLMNMLNPTAIANPSTYGPEDIKGLFLRAFKKDIKDQVSGDFPERQIFKQVITASSEEEALYEQFTNLKFKTIDNKRTGNHLFKTVLEKSLFSSPQACSATINNRINRIKEDSRYEDDVKLLSELDKSVSSIKNKSFSKYQALLSTIKEKCKFDAKEPLSRIVIFSERVDTVKFLVENLRKDLKLSKDQLQKLTREGMSDIEIQSVVDEFGRESSKLRILVANDFASEGINLHFTCCQLIHFDIPWSLMTFQQRNGRIDRYGQKRVPQIHYLLTVSENEKINGDLRFLEILIEKDNEAHENIGDPLSFLDKEYKEEPEEIVFNAIESNQSVSDFEDMFNSISLEANDVRSNTGIEDALATVNASYGKRGWSVDSMTSSYSLFEDEMKYFLTAVEYINSDESSKKVNVRLENNDKIAYISTNEELKFRYKYYPKDIWPDDNEFCVTTDEELVKNEIEHSRSEDDTWPKVQLLWEQNPLMEWLGDKLQCSFGRHEAPIVSLPDYLDKDECIFLVNGSYPNKRGDIVISKWFGILLNKGKFQDHLTIKEVFERIKKIDHPNSGNSSNISKYQNFLDVVVSNAKEIMSEYRKGRGKKLGPKLKSELLKLKELKKKQLEVVQMEFDFENGFAEKRKAKKEQRERKIQITFEAYEKWIEETLETEDKPYIQLVALFKGGE
ncbi:DEAD/DEAH box helicase [Halobacteriovorax sp. HLS]|uniref:DEAD/DEAH box helicase n=1 Tax=Halobacteriovorax sp. HLS TaxID=2234000 RepID=UPI000FDCB63E|nr:DEAD/DEAH box helicase [Halobacteriovorax sp. HLS]